MSEDRKTSRIIRVDDDIWKILKRRAVPLEDSASDALRRIFQQFGLLKSPKGQEASQKASEPKQGKRTAEHERFRQEMNHALESLMQAIRELPFRLSTRDDLSRLVRQLGESAYQAGRTEKGDSGTQAELKSREEIQALLDQLLSRVGEDRQLDHWEEAVRNTLDWVLGNVVEDPLS